MPDRAIGRRAFLGRGGAAVAGAGVAIALGGTPAHAASKGQITFALTPNGGACTACRNHATNKVFSTEDAANTYRAHKGCRCGVITGQSLSPEAFAAVFTDGPVADRRNPRTAEILDKGTVDGVSVPVIAATAPVVLLGAGGAIWWWMRKRDRQAEPSPVDHGDWR